MMRRIVFTIAALAAVITLGGCAPMAVMAGVQLATSALSALDAAAPAPVDVAP